MKLKIMKIENQSTFIRKLLNNIIMFTNFHHWLLQKKEIERYSQ